jgi:hypothetical protein
MSLGGHRSAIREFEAEDWMVARPAAFWGFTRGCWNWPASPMPKIAPSTAEFSLEQRFLNLVEQQ